MKLVRSIAKVLAILAMLQLSSLVPIRLIAMLSVVGLALTLQLYRHYRAEVFLSMGTSLSVVLFLVLLRHELVPHEAARRDVVVSLSLPTEAKISGDSLQQEIDNQQELRNHSTPEWRRRLEELKEKYRR